jgi:hypothetical protein
VNITEGGRKQSPTCNFFFFFSEQLKKKIFFVLDSYSHGQKMVVRRGASLTLKAVENKVRHVFPLSTFFFSFSKQRVRPAAYALPPPVPRTYFAQQRKFGAVFSRLPLRFQLIFAPRKRDDSRTPSQKQKQKRSVLVF